MANALKRIGLTLAALLLTCIGQADAAGNGYMNEECIDTCCCEPACCGKGFISADLLYWRAFQGGLGDCYPIESFDYISSGGNVVSKFKGKGKDPKTDWGAGFRIGAGYEFGTGVDVAVVFTHFHSNSKENEGDHQKQHWKLDFNVLDIVAGRAFDVGSCFVVRPFLGLRGARIDQKLHLTTDGRDDSYGERPSSYRGRLDSYLKLGLEHHRYFNQNRLGGYGDLCLDGANLSAGFSF